MTRSANLEVHIECQLDEEYFGPWDDLSDELKEWWRDDPRVPNCEGSGILSTGCRDCPFLEEMHEEEL